MPKKKLATTPPAADDVATLSPSSQALEAKLISEWNIQDAAGRSLLRVAMQSLDQLNACEAIIKREGPLQVDRWGIAKPHAASTILRESRAGYIAALKALNLDLASLSQAEDEEV